MENTGYIVDILKDRVKVRVDRESACGGHCVSCKGCPTEAVIAECRLIGSANIGDKVRLSMDNSKFFKKLFFRLRTDRDFSGAWSNFWIYNI